jgi:hypothetical protein
MSAPVDVLAVLDNVACGAPAGHDFRMARAAVADAFDALRGCRDMLRESAKQHRLAGAVGHARHCDTLADSADVAIARVGGEA